MGPNSRIIIVDGVMPEPGTISRVEEEKARFVDMDVMLCFNSLERDEDGWLSLLKQSDERLELRRIQKMPGNILAVLELGLKPAH